MNRNRKIGLPLATVLVAGNMIGSGVFLLPASLAAIGSITVVAWLVALVAALMIAAVLAYLPRVAPDAGGLCDYAREAFGTFAGFQSNAFYWTCAWIGNIAIGVAAIGYLAKLVPWLDDPMHLAVGVIALIWCLTLLNILGPRIACQAQSLTLVVGLAPILLVAIGGWWLFDGEMFRAAWNIADKPLSTILPGALLLVFWAFLGLESASIGAAVVENPKRNVALATLGGVAIAGIVYIASCSAIMGLIPAAQLAKSTAPFADAAQLLIGPIAAALVAALAFVKASGTLSGFILVTAQVGKTAAEQKLFPSIFARVDRHGIPVINLVTMALIMSGATLLTISPTLNEQFNKLIEMSVLLCLIAYAYACAAIWRYPIVSRTERISYRSIGALAIVFCVWIIAMSTPTMLKLTVTIVAIVSLLYALVPARSTVR